MTFYLWIYVNVASKQNFLVAILKFTDGNDPDSLVRGTDPRIQIRSEVSRIRNTGSKYVKKVFSLNLYFACRSKRLLTDEGSNILVYMTGHGGDGFLKFQVMPSVHKTNKTFHSIGRWVAKLLGDGWLGWGMWVAKLGEMGGCCWEKGG